jgi:PAS domain S-box-containing protein
MQSPPDTTDPSFLATADRLGLGVAFEILVPPGGGRRFTFISPSCLERFGVAAEAALADPDAIYSLLSPEDRTRMAAHSRTNPGPFDQEVSLTRPDGEVRAIRVVAAPTARPDGAVAWTGLFIDETARRDAERSAERDRWRVQISAEAAGLGFWEFDIRTERLAWNERTKAIFGLPPDAKVSRAKYNEAIHLDDQTAVSSAFQAACQVPGGGDFSSEFRATWPNGVVRWILVTGRVLCDAAGPQLAVGTMLDITARRGLEEQRTLVLAELSHRTKNGLAYFIAMVRQIGRAAPSVPAYRDSLLGRLEAMSRSQDLLTDADGRALHLTDLLGTALEPFGADRFDLAEELRGVRLTDGLTRGLALLFHELCTNALKYGALSDAKGRVILAREAAPDGVVAISWRESGGPAVTPPSRAGFGSRLLEHALRTQGGRVISRFEPDGFVARVEFPTPA